MASAWAGLVGELLLPFEEESCAHRPKASGFVRSRLAALRRQEEEDQDASMALVMAMLRGELAEDVSESQQDLLEQQEELRPAKRSKLTATTAGATSYPEEFGLRLNLEYSNLNPYQQQFAGDFFHGDAQQQQQQEQQFDVLGSQGEEEDELSGDELTLGSEHAFITQQQQQQQQQEASFSNGYSREQWEDDEQE